ncbi:MAG: OmpA family protein [Chitinophagales bacterium]
MKKIIFLLTTLLLFSCHNHIALAQSKKAQAYYTEADNAFVYGKIDEALLLFMKAAVEDDTYIDPFIQIANIQQNYKQNYGEAATYYEKVLALDNTLIVGHYNAAICYSYTTDFEKARTHAQNYLEKGELKGKALWEANLLIASIDFAENAIANPVDFNPENLGENINSDLNEYFPSITADNEYLYFTVMDGGMRYPDENIYVSKQKNEQWESRKKLNNTINSTTSNEGAHAINIDGKYLFFATDKRENNEGRFDIFMTKKVGDEWQNPFNMGTNINSRGWESQPMLSADGRTLYFVAKRDDGVGGSDIYMSYLGNDGTFGEAQNLGDVINTMGDEQRPQLHPDGKTLYFASNGHVGMGAMDIFKSTKDENGEWTTPVNLGYPINSTAQELGMYVSADGEKAYIASEREGGYGGMDIYSFDLPKESQPNAVVNVKGKTFDNATTDAVSGLIRVYDLSTGSLYKVMSSDKMDGSFLLTLPVGKNYSYTVTSDGYLPFSANFSIEDVAVYETYFLEAGLAKAISGQEFALHNVFFDSNSATLKDESKVELKQLFKFLKNNPEMQIEIGGHTDDVGEENDNQILSENRAKAVLDYLVENGIDADRLTSVGYGETVPIVENNSDENRAKNRRTTFKVL